MHPLSPKCDQFSDQELADKISDLERKLAACYRMNQAHLANQISMLLQDLKFEHQIRMQKMLENTMKQNGKNLDSIIDIK